MTFKKITIALSSAVKKFIPFKNIANSFIFLLIPNRMSKLITSIQKVALKPAVTPALNFLSTKHVNYSTKKEVTFETAPYRLYKLESGPSTKANVTRQEALDMYKVMAQCRRLETAGSSLYKEKLIRGFCHLYSGQEAVAIGMHMSMRPQDTLITAYRCHAWTHLMGATPIEVLTELTGRRTGVSRGKGGSMHLYAKNFYGGNGIVGAQVPLGAGLGFAHKYKDDKGVAFALYGDGAANQGQIFEAFNMAKLWSLPVVFVCENNIYGMGTSADRASSNDDFYTRGDAIPGIWVDGMDVLASREATKFAINYCTSGKGPLLMEMETYRYFGHSMSDPGTSYRTREEVQEVRKTRDPITSFKEKIINASLVSEDELKAIDKEIRIVIDEATKKAKSEPELPLEALAHDVSANIVNPNIRGVLPTQIYQHKVTEPPVNL